MHISALSTYKYKEQVAVGLLQARQTCVIDDEDRPGFLFFLQKFFPRVCASTCLHARPPPPPPFAPPPLTPSPLLTPATAGGSISSQRSSLSAHLSHLFLCAASHFSRRCQASHYGGHATAVYSEFIIRESTLGSTLQNKTSTGVPRGVCLTSKISVKRARSALSPPADLQHHLILTVASNRQSSQPRPRRQWVSLHSSFEHA